MLRVLYVIPIGNGIPIFGYGLMLMLGFVTGLALTCWRARKYGIKRDTVIDVGIIATLSGIVGARLTFLFLDYTPADGKIGNISEWLAVWEGGLTFQGGLVLAIIMSYLYLRFKKISVGAMFDVFAPGLSIGVGFGRFGCLMNGCCWGSPAPHESLFGMTFPSNLKPVLQQITTYNHHPADWAILLERLGYPAGTVPPIPLYATQIISAIGLFLVGLGLIWAERRWPYRRQGQVVLWFVFAYSIGRFFIEFWRDDTPLRYGFGAFEGLKLGQWLAVAMFVAGLVMQIYVWKKGRVQNE